MGSGLNWSEWVQCRLYGSNICGEGGEYETLALEGPLFRHACIQLDAWDVQLHSPDSVAPVGVLHPIEFRLLPSLAASTGDQAAADEDASNGGGGPSGAATGPSVGRTVVVPADFWASPVASSTGGIRSL